MKEYLFLIALLAAGGFMGYQMGYNKGLEVNYVSVEDRTKEFVEGVIPIGMHPIDFNVREENVLYWIASGEGIQKDGNTPSEAAYEWLDSLFERRQQRIRGVIRKVLTEASEASQK